MNSIQIDYFLALYKYGTFSETARRLYISQASVSKQIAALEDELGIKLLERQKDRKVVTEEGKIMLRAFEQARDLIDQAKRDVWKLHNQDKTSLRLAILSGIDLQNRLSMEFKEFRRRHPDIVVSLENVSVDEANNGLHYNTYDVVITSENEVKGDSLVSYVPISVAQKCVIANSASGLTKDGVLDMEKLKTQTFFCTKTSDRSFESYYSFIAKKFGVTEKQIKIVDDIETMLANVELGHGVVMLTNEDRHLENPNLMVFPLDDDATFNFVAAWNYKNRNPARDLLLSEIVPNLLNGDQ